MVTVESRAKRILGRLSFYRSLSDEDTLAVAGGVAGRAFGVYESPGGCLHYIFVCENGLVINRNGGEDIITYDDISEVGFNEVSERIVLKLRNGIPYVLIVSGREFNFFDSTEFVRFLDRVKSDAVRNS